MKVPDGGHSAPPVLPLSSEGQKVVGADCTIAFPCLQVKVYNANFGDKFHK